MRPRTIPLLLALALAGSGLGGCSRGDTSPPKAEAPKATAGAAAGPKTSAKRAVATLAGGCFWGMEDLLRKIPGVVDTQVGYTGGQVKGPTYRDVSGGGSGHAETVQIIYDPAQVSYETILLTFFKIHDPTTLNRQGNDVGSQYRSVIFVHDEEQRRVAEQVKQRVADSGQWSGDIVTRIVAATEFYPAEDYHQDYLVKNPSGYTCHYERDYSF